MSHFAFVFPGQGSQSVGMGKALAAASPAAAAVFAEADDALGSGETHAWTQSHWSSRRAYVLT